jgi:hypothetical protein
MQVFLSVATILTGPQIRVSSSCVRREHQQGRPVIVNAIHSSSLKKITSLVRVARRPRFGCRQQSIHVSQVRKKEVVVTTMESSGSHSGGEVVAFRRQNQVRQLRTPGR